MYLFWLRTIVFRYWPKSIGKRACKYYEYRLVDRGTIQGSYQPVKPRGGHNGKRANGYHADYKAEYRPIDWTHSWRVFVVFYKTIWATLDYSYESSTRKPLYPLTRMGRNRRSKQLSVNGRFANAKSTMLHSGKQPERRMPYVRTYPMQGTYFLLLMYIHQ